MKNTLLFLFLTYFHSFHFCQINGAFYELTSSSYKESVQDLSALDQFFNHKRVIGVGESTHGTAEFTTMRLRLFKYLVENHGFNTFFLEADYSACRRIDRYINGEQDTVTETLQEVRLWPWITYEMVELIEWMKSYNTSHDQKIHFVGCDMQLLEDDIQEWTRFDALPQDLSNRVDSILHHLKANQQNTVSIKSIQGQWNDLWPGVNVSSLDDANRDALQFMRNGIDQWLDHRLNHYEDYNHRDSCMALNIQNYLNKYPESKGLFFGHNAHISTTRISYKKKYYPLKSAGFHLQTAYGQEYLAIGQTTSSGTFNAINYKDGIFTMEIFSHAKRKRRSLEHQINSLNSGIILFDMDTLDKNKSFQMMSIGAVFGRTKDGKKIFGTSTVKPEYYDLMIHIPETHHTTLINTLMYKK